jgi:hypothetical protein
MVVPTAYPAVTGRLSLVAATLKRMSTRSDDERARSRAEARRRARLAARGELPDEGDEPSEPATGNQPGAGGNLLTRIFPPAPPLPNKPDPLAGFDRTGPLRPIRERLFLLRSSPLAWILPGFVAFLGFFASIFYRQGLLGLIGTFVLFGALIAAGWYGWQRPSLFGTAAALISFILSAAFIIWTFASQGAGPDTFGTTEQVAIELVLQAGYQAGLGFLGGWYGGYLRRRQTQLSSQVRRRR